MKAYALPALILAFGLAACGSNPLEEASAALQAKDFGKAEAVSAKVLQKKPGSKDAHALRFVMFWYLSVQGDAGTKASYLNQAIGEYDKLAKILGLSPNYQDMEGSLKSNPEGAALLAANRKLLYGE